MKPHPLKVEREQRGWSQARVAEAVGVSTHTVIRWEQRRAIPYPYHREQLAQLFGKSVQELELLPLGQQPAQKEPAATGHQPLNNLPVQLTSLIGREQEIQAVCALMRQPEVRLVTLLGPGGVGKTRLGLAVAQSILSDFADGVCFVSLAPIYDPEQVIPTIAKTLGLWEAGDQPLLKQLQAALHE